MKKIYTLFALLTAALCSMVAHAEERTVTIHVDDPSHISSVKFYGIPGAYTFDNNNSIEVKFGQVNDENQFELDIDAADGFEIVSIEIEGNTNSYCYDKFPKASATIVGYESYTSSFNVEDGDVVEITTREKQAAEKKILTVKALHPEHMDYVQFGYDNVTPTEEGVWEIDATEKNGYVKVYLKNDFLIRSVTDKAGNALKDAEPGSYSFMTWSADYTESDVFTVDSYSSDEARSATLTVKIEEGDASDVTFYRGGKTLALDGTESVVKFDPETESEFKVIRNPWSKKFYKVLLGEEEIEADKNGYHVFTPQSGDVLTIKVGYPDVNVPVKFEGTKEALVSVSCNGTTYSAEECLADGFTLKLGSTFYVSCDEAQYDVTGTLFNGVDGFKGEILTEDEFVVTIVATKIQMTEVTVKCDAWEHISLEDDWYKAINLTGAETELSLNPSLEYMIISTKDGYVLNSVTDEATGKDLLEVEYYNTKIVGFESGMTIVIDASKFVRDKEMVVYLEENIEWKDQRFFLSYYSDLEERITLAEGYTTIAFGNGDFSDSTFAVEPADDADVVVYLNDEKMEMESSYYGPYPVGMDKIQDGDVMKIFSEEKTPHTVTYQIPEGVNAEIVHDHVKTIDSPSTHDVLPGTEIHIKPVASKTRDAASGLIVTVNDEVQAPGADGIYTVKVDSPKTIKVENDPSTSISEISAAGTSTKAFDLQGRRVSANHRGLIIENGTLKVRK